MKDKEKAAFLRAEGWRLKYNHIHRVYVWVDPYGDAAYWGVEKPYRIAKRRKSQREARALREAFIKCNEGGYHEATAGGVLRCLSRGEAVNLLTSRKGS